MAATLPFDKAKQLADSLATRIVDDGIDHDVFSDWAGDDSGREGFLAYSVWGTIRWDRSLGRPAGASMASGFVVTHDAYWKTFLLTANGILEKAAWFAQGDVALYDLPDDGDSHRVGFSCRDDDHPPYTGENRVSASFTADHSWTSKLVSVHGLPLPRWIEPSGQAWTATHAPVILPEFVVK